MDKMMKKAQANTLSNSQAYGAGEGAIPSDVSNKPLPADFLNSFAKVCAESSSTSVEPSRNYDFSFLYSTVVG